MPYSFTKIEQEKSRVIVFVQVFLIVLYFLMTTAFFVLARMMFYSWISIDEPRGTLAPYPVHVHIKWLSFFDMLFIMGFSVLAAMFHWSIATRNLVTRVLDVLRARLPDKDNFRHQQFLNIVEELSVATGGHPFEGRVIPSSSVNAFSVADFEHVPVIGVTDGLLTQLKRPQIEAVLGHEAAHILKGDSLDTTIIVSLFNLPAEILSDFMGGEDDTLLYAARVSPQGRFLSALGLMMVFLSKMIGQLLGLFLSRQREYRADAIAVRLTRDPLSMAEGLYLASYHWRGSGVRGEHLSPLFIVRPSYNEFNESDGVLAGLLSTHPPVRQRLNILLDMAHSDWDGLEESIWGSYKKILDRMRARRDDEDKWIVRKSGDWLGPFTHAELAQCAWLCPDMLVKRMGDAQLMTVAATSELQDIIEKRKFEFKSQTYCPKCYLVVHPVLYEGGVILTCRGCGGCLVEKKDLERILTVKEATFGEDVTRMARIIREEKVVTKKSGEEELYSKYGLACPLCRNYDEPMTRRFYSDRYHVEIDECRKCRKIWFDKWELEILQYLLEEDTARGCK